VFGIPFWRAARLGTGLVLVAAFWPFSVSAQPLDERDQAIFGFAAAYSSGDLGTTAAFVAPFDGNFAVGAGYQHYLVEPFPDLLLGAEFGVAGRFGDTETAEAWLGVTARYDGIVLGDVLRIAPALTLGLSLVSGPTGTEHGREILREGDASLLFYMAPEIALSLVSHPNLELFYRLQHRSGLYGTLGGGLREGYNGNALGLRFRF